MLYVKTEDLKVGMRLARPIYSRNGTLLYERNSKLTHQGIISVRNFRIIGLYILEPAEPVPPMTKEDLEFERFQTMSVFSIQDELTAITKKQDSKKLNALANQIIKMYGNLYHKINFMQNLRSRSDYIYKHSINTAILCALISHQLEFSFEEQMDVVTAALLHDIHKLFLPDELVEQEFRNQTIDTNDSHYAVVKKEVKEAQALLQSQVYISSNVKKIITQLHHNILSDNPLDEKQLLKGTKVLRVAEGFDGFTAMKSYTDPTSEVTALRALLADRRYEQEVVKALTESIHILAAGVCVTLTNGDKGIVIAENDNDVLRPVVLSFYNNSIMDLGLRTTFGKIQVLDVMKTMDNRFVMDEEVVDKFFGTGKGVIQIQLTPEEQEEREEAAKRAEEAAIKAEEDAKKLKETEKKAAKEAAISKLDYIDPFADDVADSDVNIDDLFDFGEFMDEDKSE